MNTVTHGYIAARERLVEAGYGEEIAWAESLGDVKPDATYVMRETAWVIVNSGFRHVVAEKLWPRLSAVFWHWDPGCIGEDDVPKAKRVLAHEGKLKAIVEVARILHREGHEFVVSDATVPERLTRLPFIGKVTCYHLAKLLGADVVKPDVHLVRAAKAAGIAVPLGLCQIIARETGDRITVIDSVLWRYGEQQAKRGWPTWADLWTPPG